MTQQRSKFRSYLLLAMACLLTILPINQPSQKAPATQNRTSDTRVSGQCYATFVHSSRNVGNLYHLNAEEEPEGYFYPKDPEFKKLP